MKKKLLQLLNFMVIMTLLIPLTGCYDLSELEDKAFVVTLAIDKGPGDTIDVSTRIAIPRELSAGGGGGGGGGGGAKGELGGSKTITVRAHTILEALTLLNASVERRVSIIHLSGIVFGEEIAKEGLLRYIQPMTRYREFRRTVYMFVSRGKAKDLLVANQPLLEQTVTRYIQDLASSSQQSGLAPTRKIHDFLIGLEVVHEDGIAPLMAVNTDVLKQSEKESKKSGSDDKRKEEQGSKRKINGKGVSFKTGETRRSGGNPNEIIGTAVFKDDHMVEMLDGKDTRLLLGIRGELNRVQSEFSDPLKEGESVNVTLRSTGKPVIKVNLNANPVQIQVRQKLDGDLIGMESGVDYSNEHNLRVLQTEIAKRLSVTSRDLMVRLFHEDQTDPFGIFTSQRSHFVTYQDFANYNWEEKLRKADVKVDIDLKIRRIGTQLTPIQ